MSEYNTKNYTEQGGDVTHIGGSLVIEDGATVEGLPSPELPVASSSNLGGVKVGSGLSVTEEGMLSADNQLPSVSSSDNRKGLVVVSGKWAVGWSALEDLRIEATYDGSTLSVTIPGQRRALLGGAVAMSGGIHFYVYLTCSGTAPSMTGCLELVSDSVNAGLGVFRGVMKNGTKYYDVIVILGAYNANNDAIIINEITVS